MKPGQAVARSYAKALFALASERSQTAAVARELEVVIDVVRREPELRAFLERPFIGAGAKRSATAEIAARMDVSKLVRDFFVLVAARGRADQLEAIGAAYREMLDAAEGRVRARVRTAVALTPDERATLASRLGRALEGKQVVIEEVVDPGLLGGFVAEIDSLVVDGSLDGQLARIRQRLAAEPAQRGQG
jgi:F-type H+-transporting ATPase subunit delta